MNIVPRLLALLNTSELAPTFSAMIGEGQAATQMGVAAAVPSILGALIAKGSTESGAASLIRLITEHKLDGSLLDQLALLFGGRTPDEQAGLGERMLGAVLDDNRVGLTQLITSASGLSGAGAAKLMALVTPAVLGGVATAAPASGFQPSTLAAFLASQKSYLGAFAPAGLSDLLGLGALGSAEAPLMAGVGLTLPVASVAPREAVGVAALAAPSFLQMLWPWLVLAALLLLALFGLRSCLSATPKSVVPAPTITEAVPATAEAPVPAPTQLTLPSGNVLSVPPGSVGENLYKFLIGQEAGSKTFLFDGLTFDTGQATLDARSQATITAIADILKEFGTVTVSVDGYTDNTGTREANLQLSQARAEQVLTALAAAGVDASRMAATGHADDNPVADNGTAEGRAQNRRTELTATKN